MNSAAEWRHFASVTSPVCLRAMCNAISAISDTNAPSANLPVLSNPCLPAGHCARGAGDCPPCFLTPGTSGGHCADNPTELAANSLSPKIPAPTTVIALTTLRNNGHVRELLAQAAVIALTIARRSIPAHQQAIAPEAPATAACAFLFLLPARLAVIALTTAANQRPILCHHGRGWRGTVARN